LEAEYGTPATVVPRSCASSQILQGDRHQRVDVTQRKEGRIAHLRRLFFCKLNVCHSGKQLSRNRSSAKSHPSQDIQKEDAGQGRRCNRRDTLRNCVSHRPRRNPSYRDHRTLCSATQWLRWPQPDNFRLAENPRFIGRSTNRSAECNRVKPDFRRLTGQ
jgi:hypothetical protein